MHELITAILSLHHQPRGGRCHAHMTPTSNTITERDAHRDCPQWIYINQSRTATCSSIPSLASQQTRPFLSTISRFREHRTIRRRQRLKHQRQRVVHRRLSILSRTSPFFTSYTHPLQHLHILSPMNHANFQAIVSPPWTCRPDWSPVHHIHERADALPPMLSFFSFCVARLSISVALVAGLPYVRPFLLIVKLSPGYTCFLAAC